MNQPIRFLLLVLTLMLSACVTQRQKSDLSTMGRFYHNKTAKFNAYYNADVLYTEAIDLLNQSYPENYKQLLPIYRYSEVDNADGISKSMDRAIEKVAKSAKIHPGSDWVADCYVLMGKAQFLKQDYESAQTTFEYFADQFDPKNPQNRVRSGSAKSRSRLSKKERDRQRKQAQKVREDQQKERQKERKAQQKEREEVQKTRDQERKEREKEIKARKKARSKAKKKGTRTRPTQETTTETLKTNPNQTPDTKTSSDLGESPKKEEQVQEEKKEKEEDITKSKDYNQDKKDEGLFGHRDPYSEGRIWLAKTYIKRQKYSKAEYYLEQVLEDPMSYKGDITEAHIVLGDLYIHERDYPKAIGHLETGIERTKDKALKARLHFIIGQLHSELNNLNQASENYQLAIKNKPSYEMTFNAGLNKLTTGMAGGSIQANQALDQLDKMLKDEKNIDFHDQIHFAKAEILLSMGDAEMGYQELLLALENSQGNRAQLAETHYKLAWISFENEDYVKAKEHFDGAVANLNQNDPRYAETQDMASSLEDIARHIENIEKQDSLLKIASMTDAEKLAFAKEKLQNERQANNATNSKAALVEGDFGVNSGSEFWAFGDRRDIEKQIRNFQRTWGDRGLQDDWRRGGVASIQGPEEETSNNPTDELIVSESDIERILDEVPTNPQEEAKIIGSIMESMVALGKLYRVKINQPQKSIDILEQMLERFPTSAQRLDAYFYLYLGYRDLNNTASMNKYKDIILNEFPDSEYAKILGDPNYANKQDLDRKKLEDYYNKTYDLFTAGDYSQAEKRIADALTTFGPDHRYIARMALLSAMIEGSKSDNPETYIGALQAFAKKYPDTEETIRAREIIRLLGGKDDVGLGIASEVNTKGFELKDDKLHYIIIVLYNPNTYSAQDAKVQISNYNQEYHKLEKLKMTSISLSTTNDTPIILLRRFENRKKAMKYYEGVQRKREKFLPIEAEFEVFAINQVNYREVMRQRNVSDYREFFKENYLGEK